MKYSLDKILAIVVRVVCVCWALWVGVEYFARHPTLTDSIATMPYGGLLFSFFALAAFGTWWSVRKMRSNDGNAFQLGYKGFWAYLLVQLLAAVVLVAFVNTAYMPGKLNAVTRVGYFFCFSTLCFFDLFLIVTLAHTLGNLLSKGKLALTKGNRSIVNIALGFSLIGFVLAILGQFGGIKPLVLWPMLVLVLAWQWRSALGFVLDTVWKTKKITISHWWTLAVLLLLLVVVGINWVSAFKAFPIGYDGAGTYVNLAFLIADSGTLPAGGQAFGWSTVMAFGQVLFGDELFSILLAHLVNILVLLALYRLGRFFLSSDRALLATALTYAAPYFAFHSIVDEKTDLAYTFIVISSLLLLIDTVGKRWLDSSEPDGTVSLFAGRFKMSTTTYVLLLAGWLVGYAFGIKYTVLMYLFALVAWLFYLHGGKWAFGGALLGTLGLLFVGGIYRFGYLPIEVGDARLLGGILLLLGAVAMFMAYRNKLGDLIIPLRSLSWMALTFLLAFAPWGIKHLSEHQSFGVQQLMEGRKASPDISLYNYGQIGEQLSPENRQRWSDIQDLLSFYPKAEATDFGQLTKTTQQDKLRNATETGAREEIQRYIGYEPTLWRYLSLPYDLTTNANIPVGRYLNIGFFFLLMLPLLFLGRGKRRWLWSVPLFLIGVFLYVSLIQLSTFSDANHVFDAAVAQAEIEQNLNAHKGGIGHFMSTLYVAVLSVFFNIATSLAKLYQSGTGAGTLLTVILMLIISLIAFLLLRGPISKAPKAFKAFAGLLFVYGLFWWLMGNGIIWYGLPLFAAFPILLLYWQEQPELLLGEDSSRFSNYFIGTSTGLVLLCFTAMYFTSIYPTDESGNALFRWPFVENYTNPVAKKKAAYAAFNPVLPDLVRAINADLDGKVYKVNTHFGYLIKGNDHRVFDDPVLEKYDGISSRLSKNDEFFDVLKSQGFRYILFDLNTGSMDHTVEKSLQKKFVSIARALTETNKLKLLVTDNLVADPNGQKRRLPDGRTANVKYGLRGQTMARGDLALFEIR